MYKKKSITIKLHLFRRERFFGSPAPYCGVWQWEISVLAQIKVKRISLTKCYKQENYLISFVLYMEQHGI